MTEDDIQEDLEDNVLAWLDADEDATDPQVDAAELLGRMDHLRCRYIPPTPKKKKKKDGLVKDVGEGDWGEDSDPEDEATGRVNDYRMISVPVPEGEPARQDFQGSKTSPLVGDLGLPGISQGRQVTQLPGRPDTQSKQKANIHG